MNEENDNDSEQPPEHWFSNFEDECLNELEAQGRVEARLQAAEENSAQQLWLGFQHTSSAIAQLYNYKDSDNDGYFLLVPFNKAAESLTKLYKVAWYPRWCFGVAMQNCCEILSQGGDYNMVSSLGEETGALMKQSLRQENSLNNARECLALGMQSGRSSRARDIAAWVRKKRKCIRRDELLAYLCGKNLPPHSNNHRNRQNRSIERQLPHRTSHHSDSIDTGEYPVRETFSLQGLNGAMSNISMGYSRPSTDSGCTVSSLSRSPVVDYLYHDELARSSEHRKRRNSSSATDVSMESPSRKKGKLL